jgi:hypothetical protein
MPCRYRGNTQKILLFKVQQNFPHPTLWINVSQEMCVTYWFSGSNRKEPWENWQPLIKCWSVWMFSLHSVMVGACMKRLQFGHFWIQPALNSCPHTKFAAPDKLFSTTGNKYAILNIHKSWGQKKDTYFGSKTIQCMSFIVLVTTFVSRTSSFQILLQLVFQALKHNVMTLKFISLLLPILNFFKQAIGDTAKNIHIT